MRRSTSRCNSLPLFRAIPGIRIGAIRGYSLGPSKIVNIREIQISRLRVKHSHSVSFPYVVYYPQTHSIMPSGPPFFVVARVVGRDGAFQSVRPWLLSDSMSCILIQCFKVEATPCPPLRSLCHRTSRKHILLGPRSRW